MSINAIIKKIPGFINDDFMNSKVEDSLANYRDADGDISKENFNIFVDDAVDAGIFTSAVQKGADEYFGYLDSNQDDNLSEEELTEYLKSNYGIEFGYALRMEGSDLVDYILSVETGEMTADEIHTELEEKYGVYKHGKNGIYLQSAETVMGKFAKSGEEISRCMKAFKKFIKENGAQVEASQQ